MFRIKLKELREKKGISQYRLADELKLSQSAIGNWEAGKREPDFATIQRIADYFGVTVDYILGREEMKFSEVRKGGGKWIPVYGHIAAGIPIEAIEDIIDYEEISEEMLRHGEYVALQVKGDSMEPKIAEGDTVIIRLQDTIENGEIAAVYVNGNDVTLKKIKKEENGIWLIGNNPAFSPIFYTKQQCEELPVRILGKLVELRAKF